MAVAVTVELGLGRGVGVLMERGAGVWRECQRAVCFYVCVCMTMRTVRGSLHVLGGTALGWKFSDK